MNRFLSFLRARIVYAEVREEMLENASGLRGKRRKKWMFLILLWALDGMGGNRYDRGE